MAQCNGRIPITAKVDADMRDLIDEDADRLGVYRAEVIRRVLDTYRESREDQLVCPHCDGRINFDL